MAFFGSTGSSLSTALSGSALASTTAPDVEVANPPADSISSLAWSPTADFLAVGSWDNQVRTKPRIAIKKGG